MSNPFKTQLSICLFCFIFTEETSEIYGRPPLRYKEISLQLEKWINGHHLPASKTSELQSSVYLTSRSHKAKKKEEAWKVLDFSLRLSPDLVIPLPFA